MEEGAGKTPPVPGLRQVPEGLPKVARQFYWRVAVVDFESRAVGTIEIAVVLFKRPAGARFCRWARVPGVGNAGLLSDVPNGTIPSGLGLSRPSTMLV